MSWLDSLIIAIVVGCVVYSLWRGLVRELLSLGSLVLASILATRYCKLGSAHLTGVLGNERLATVVGFALIFLGVVACGIFTGRLAKSFLKKAGLSPMDKTLGAVLGFIKAGVIVAVLLMLISNFAPNGEKVIDNSQVAPVFMPIANRLSDFLPTSLWDKLVKDVKRGVKKYKDKLEENGDEIEDLKKKYGSELEKILPESLQEHTEEAKENLEEDREKIRNLLKENL